MVAAASEIVSLLAILCYSPRTVLNCTVPLSSAQVILFFAVPEIEVNARTLADPLRHRSPPDF
jgi:hypothetical protein